jgi:drug/metabolite transporter (DMT)-like permease
VRRVAVLALVCTVAALLLFFALILEVGAPTARWSSPSSTRRSPCVLGILVLSEPLTVGTLIGFPLVLLGCVLATRRTRSPPDRSGGRRRGLEQPVPRA